MFIDKNVIVTTFLCVFERKENIPESAKIIDKHVKMIEFIADNMVYCKLDKCKF